MARKITSLTAATNLRATDVLQLVDIADTTMSTSGTNKKITIANFAASIISQIPAVAESQITTEKIALSAITTEKIALSAVTTNRINNLAVTADKLAVDSVTTVKIVNQAVNSDKLAVDSVITPKIYSQAVTTEKIALSAVTTAVINNKAITTDKIALSAITTDRIALTAITTDKIALSAVTTDRINNQSVTLAKLAPNILNDALAGLTITTDKISLSAVTTEVINNKAITTAKLALTAVTTDRIALSAVTTDRINNQAITQVKLAPNVVGQGPLFKVTIVPTTTTTIVPNGNIDERLTNFTVMYDTNSGVSAGEYTIPITGYYLFLSTIYNSVAGVANINPRIKQNGVSMIEGNQMGAATVRSTCQTILSCTAGDKMQIWVIASNNVTVTGFFEGAMIRSLP